MAHSLTRYPRGGSTIFLGGGALVSCSTSTPIKHIVFFCRIPVVLENRRSSQGGRGCAPPAPSPSIRPWICLIKSMIIDRTGRLEVLLPLNHNHYNFRENKCILLFLLIPTIQKLGKITLAETPPDLPDVTNSSILENPQRLLLWLL